MSEKMIDEQNRLIRLRDQLNNGELDSLDVTPEDLKRLRELVDEEFNSRRISAILNVLSP